MGRDKETFKKEYKAAKQSIDNFKSMIAGFVDGFDSAKKLYNNNNNRETVKAGFENLMKASFPPDDKDAYLEFIKQNTIVIALLESEQMAQYFNDERYADSAEFQQMIKDSAEIRKSINNWFEYYDKYADEVLDEEGNVRASGNASPDSPQEKAKAANKEPVRKLSVSAIIQTAKSEFEETSLDEFKEYLNLIRDSIEESTPEYVLTGMYMMANKYPEDKEMLLACKDMASLFVKKDEDGSFKRFIRKGEGKVMMGNLIEKWNSVSLEQNKNVKAEKAPEAGNAAVEKSTVERVNRYTRINAEIIDLEDFARLLSSASKHDKQDYKELVAMVSAFSSMDKFLSMKDNKPVAGTENLTDEQREALPFFKIKGKIDAYIAHKAKDGVNRNAYAKLAVVESLNQYVSRKIKNLNPGEFSFEGVTYKSSDVHVTYADELNAERAKIQGPDVLNNIMSARGINNPNGVEINAENVLIDTSINDQNNARATGLGKKDLAVYKSVAGCMNRIMLKAQIDNIPKTLKSIAEGKDPDRIPKHLNDASDSFILKPVKFKATVIKEKEAIQESAISLS